jgi:lipoprotein-anchoring transpeptidase ErfK/SrfK
MDRADAFILPPVNKWLTGERVMNVKLAAKNAAYAGIALASSAFLASTNVHAQVLAMATESITGSISREAAIVSGAPQPSIEAAAVPARLRRQVVDYPTSEAPGTIIVDTPNTYLYFVLGGGKAIRYGIGVGRDGFTWSGIKTIDRKSEWPDWFPPADMLQRQPYLPRFMAGGPGNPLGARAMYLSGTVFRIHGTNKPSSIGTHVSSGCIRMLNADVTDLYERVHIGTRVVVLPMTHQHVAQDVRRTGPVVREATFAPSLR